MGGGMNIFAVLTMVISRVYTYVNPCQIVHLNLCRLLYVNYSSIKLFLKKGCNSVR